MKIMANQNHNSASPTIFTDAFGVNYYQQSQVKKYLLLKHARCIYPRLSNRLATPEELPILKRLGMKISNCKNSIRLMEVDAVNDWLEQQEEEEYSPVKRKRKPLKKLFRSAVSGTATPTWKVIESPTFSTVQLVGQVLLRSVNKGLSRYEIVKRIMESQQPYPSRDLSDSVMNALSKSRFFEHSVHPRQWQIAAKHKAELVTFVYRPSLTRRRARRARSREERPTTTIGTTLEHTEKSPHEVQTEEEYVVSHSQNGDGIQTNAGREYRSVQAETSGTAVRQEHPRPAVTAVADSASREIEPEILDIVEDDEFEFKDQFINQTHQINCKINSITSLAAIDIVDLTADEIDLQAPICEAINRAVEMKQPPFSTVKLVGQAMLTVQNKGLTSREIATWIADIYPYYQSVNCLSMVCTALSKSKFFVKLSSLWYIVHNYEASLKEFVHIPEFGKRRRGRPPKTNPGTTTERPLPQAIIIDEASETTAESRDEDEILTGNLRNDGSTASYSQNGDDTNRMMAEQECRPVQAETSGIAVRQEQPRIAVTVVAASPSQEIKPEILDIANTVEDQSSNRGLEFEVNPTIIPTTTDAINLTENEIGFECPICDVRFGTKKALGGHVVTHKKAQPNNDASRKANEVLRNVSLSHLLGRNNESLISSLLGGDGELPIFVFSGNNIYFTPTTS